MSHFVVNFLKKLLLGTCIIALVLSATALVGCSQPADPCGMMESFANSYPLMGIIYSPRIPQQEEGHVGKEFFTSLFGEGERYVADYAVIFTSAPDAVGECSVLVCHSEYEALLAADMCRRRLDMLGKMSNSLDTSSLTDSFVIKSGKIVVMSALPDNALSRNIWRKIL